MTDGDPNAHDAELRAVERALAALPRPAARPEFRARLFEEFVGRASGRRATHEIEAARARLQLRPRAWPRVLAIAAAAALLLVVPFLRTGSTEPGWRAVEFDAADEISIDARHVALADGERLSDELRQGGCELRTLEAEAYLVRNDELLLRCEARSRIDLLPPLVEDGRELMRLELHEGAAFASMAPDYRGLIRVETRHGTVELEGEAVSVELVEKGLCICCLRGRASVRTPSGFRSVSSGRTLFVPADGSGVREHELVVHLDVVGAAHGVAQKYLSR